VRRILDSLVPPSSGQRFPALDGLRGLAALAVMLWHLTPIRGTIYVRYGQVAVTCFFALSAFLLYYPAAAGKPFDIRCYAIRRIWRIYPAWLAALTFGVIVMLVQDKPLPLKHLAAHLVFMQNWFLSWPQMILPSAWSIVTEVQFYVILPLLVMAFAAGRRGLLIPALALAAVAQILAFPPGRLGMDWLDWHIIALPFFCGMIAATIVTRSRSVRGPLTLVGIVLLLGVGATTETSAGRTWIQADVWRYLFLGPRGLIPSVGAMLAIMGAATTRNGILQRFLVSSPIRLCGIAGYGLFLLHPPLFQLLTAIGPAWALLAFGPPLAIILGIASYYWVEAPAMRHARSRVDAILKRSTEQAVPAQQ
jgi:peptidoglycan/LPS O-acetylase OafA/YrhL